MSGQSPRGGSFAETAPQSDLLWINRTAPLQARNTFGEVVVERSRVQLRISRALHGVGDITSRSSIAAVVAGIVVTFTALLVAFDFPSTWEAGFSAIASGITLLMLFVIQHTQSRQQAVTQLKLDELIRSSPRADDLLVHLETAEDEELIAREEDQIAHHTSLRDDGEPEVDDDLSTDQGAR